MHMHPPRAFNIQYSNIFDLKLRLKLYTSITMHAQAPTTFVGCLTSQQHASVSQGRIRTDNFTCCHTEIEVQIQLSTSPSHSILTPGRPTFNTPIFTISHLRLKLYTNITMHSHPPRAFYTLLLTLYQHIIHQKRITIIYIKNLYNCNFSGSEKKNLCLPKRLVTSFPVRYV